MIGSPLKNLVKRLKVRIYIALREIRNHQEEIQSIRDMYEDADNEIYEPDNNDWNKFVIEYHESVIRIARKDLEEAHFYLTIITM